MSVLHEIVFAPDLFERLRSVVLSRYPAKSFGYLVCGGISGTARQPTDFLLFQENIRNDEGWREEFESRGRYFVDHPDAGFVATAQESFAVHQYMQKAGLSEIAVFHTHRRHPGNFSNVDYDLHTSRFGSLWHLIISLRNPAMPQFRAFDVTAGGVRELDVVVEGGRR